MANYNVYLSDAFTNAIENVTNGIFSISSDGELSSDVVNQLVSFGGTAVKDLDYTWYYSSVDNFSGKIDIVPVDNSAWDASKSVTLTLGKASIEVGFFCLTKESIITRSLALPHRPWRCGTTNQCSPRGSR